MSKLGIVGVGIDSSIASNFSGLRITSGVIVAAKSAAPNVEVSLVAGDVIHAINGMPVVSVEGLRSALDRLSTNSPVVLQIERDCKLMFIAFKLDGSD